MFRNWGSDMADILIKGMEMPKSCDRCLYRGFCSAHARQVQKIMESDADQVFDIFGEMRLKDCPLVEIPPHGDLIDRDALKKHMTDLLRYDYVFDEVGCFGLVKDAPTVLETSK